MEDLLETSLLDFVDILVHRGTRTSDGLRLPTERSLAEITGMSRTRVREYLSGLQALGLLARLQGSGNVLVAADQHGNVFELMLRARIVSLGHIAQAREMMEIAIAPRIVEHVTNADIKRLESHVYAMIDASAAGDVRRGLEADHAFHLDLFAILGNPVMSYVINGMHGALLGVLRERRRIAMGIEVARNGGQRPTTYATDDVHFRITRALRARDPVAVSAAMTEHFDQWRRLTKPQAPRRPTADRHTSSV